MRRLTWEGSTSPRTVNGVSRVSSLIVPLYFTVQPLVSIADENSAVLQAVAFVLLMALVICALYATTRLVERETDDATP